ncbi:MAG: GNAT family N-acetyltransferase [Bacteroidota bacterium]
MQEIQIIDFNDAYKEAFKVLNEAWIKKYFEMEPEDYRILHHPKEHIIDKGGHIFVALHKAEPVGVCALIKMGNGPFEYELAKMGVTPKAQGNGIGYLLGRAIVQKARDLGAKTIYIESNTQLQPAIRLYQKLGFKEIEGIVTPYKRCDIQMVLQL